MARITRVEIVAFHFAVADLGLAGRTLGISNVAYAPGEAVEVHRFAVRIETDDGAAGEYVTHWGGTQGTLGQTLMLAPDLIGRDPDQRELIYDDLKRELRAYDHMGHGPLDIALWDLAGKRHGVSVSVLLGAFRRTLPVYASTHHGQEDGKGLADPQAFADYALACRERGFAGFKIHGWHDGNARREAATIHAVRRAVGPDMALMADPGCQLRTFADALYVGRACDEAGYFWYEDPFRDGSVSAVAHKRLRKKLATPLLISEHIRGPEQKAGFALAGGCDMIHADPEYDMGITGVMKIAHFAESIGMDLQIHACGPAHRHCVAALRHTHFYELALIGPKMPNLIPPVYLCGYSDQAEALDPAGCLPVPTGPGLGVAYDWDLIRRQAGGRHVFQ